MFDINYFKNATPLQVVSSYIEILETMMDARDKPAPTKTEIMTFMKNVPSVILKEFFKKYDINESGIIEEKVIVLSDSQSARNVQMQSDISILNSKKSTTSLKEIKLYSSQAYAYLKKTDCNTQEIIMILEKLILGGLMKTALHEVMGISIN
jgi:hypothetical protein